MKISEVPKYLQCGEFYQSLTCDDEEEIVVPSDCCKGDDQIGDVNDLSHLLRSVRFWLVASIPIGLLEYVLSCDLSEDTFITLSIYERELSYIPVLLEVAKSNTKMVTACALGNLEIIAFLENTGHAICRKSVFEAVKHGRLIVLQYAMHENSDAFVFQDLLQVALLGGHIPCLEFLLANGFKWDSDHYLIALQNKQWDCAIFAVKTGCRIVNYTWMLPCEEKHLELLREARDRGLPWDAKAVDYTCKMGFMNSLILLHQNGCPWNTNAPYVAAQQGHLHILKYLHENGCPWDESACSGACLNGHLHCLQYAHEQGAPWDSTTSWGAVDGNHFECLEYAVRNGCPIGTSVISTAALHANLAVVKLLHEHGCVWDARATSEAVRGKSLECLQYLHENGCPWDEHTYISALAYSQPECYLYAFRNGCSGFKRCTTLPTDDFQLQLLQIMYERGMPWTATSCAVVATRGYLQSLRYLHEHECEWDEETIVEAVVNEHVDLLQYALLQGCTYSVDKCVAELDRRLNEGDSYSRAQLACLKCMYDLGCEWDKWDTIEFSLNCN